MKRNIIALLIVCCGFIPSCKSNKTDVAKANNNSSTNFNQSPIPIPTEQRKETREIPLCNEKAPIETNLGKLQIKGTASDDTAHKASTFQILLDNKVISKEESFCVSFNGRFNKDDTELFLISIQTDSFEESLVDANGRSIGPSRFYKFVVLSNGGSSFITERFGNGAPADAKPQNGKIVIKFPAVSNVNPDKEKEETWVYSEGKLSKS